MKHWYQAEIEQAAASLLPGFAVEVLEEIDSTNTELMRRARDGRGEPVLLVAERQHAGRGRLGRPWHSAGKGAPADGALTFSLGLPLAPRDWSGLSLAVGVSLADSLDAGGRHLRLKWPNDLWLDERKLGGILIETAWPQQAEGGARYVVVGVGLNLGPRAAEGLATPPAWLRELDAAATAPGTLRQVAPPLLAAMLRFGLDGFAPFAARFAARDALAGRDVLLSDGSAGRARGVAANGALLLQRADGIVPVTSAELSVRPLRD